MYRFEDTGHKYIEVNAERNYYGGILIGTHNNKYYYTIRNFDTEILNSDVTEWTPICKKLYDLLKELEGRTKE